MYIVIRVELNKVIEFIKTRDKKQVINTFHSSLRLEERNLTLDVIYGLVFDKKE